MCFAVFLGTKQQFERGSGFKNCTSAKKGIFTSNLNENEDHLTPCIGCVKMNFGAAEVSDFDPLHAALTLDIFAHHMQKLCVKSNPSLQHKQMTRRTLRNTPFRSFQWKRTRSVSRRFWAWVSLMLPFAFLFCKGRFCAHYRKISHTMYI